MKRKMAKFIIEGGRTLKGSIRVAGNKNAIVSVLPATLLTDQDCYFENVPRIGDVLTMGKILKKMGARVEGLGTDKLKVNTRSVKRPNLDPGLTGGLRASVLFLGPLLARFGRAKMRHPGGCVIGRRAVGTHFEALAALGAKTMTTQDDYVSEVKKPRSAAIFLDEASVTATENAMMMASLVPGRTVIENAACEPHVEDLAVFLNSMGAGIGGAGTNRVVVDGVKKLSGAKHRIVPDYMEAGTLAMMAGVTGSRIEIRGVCPAHLKMTLLYLERIGLKFKLGKDSLTVFPSELTAPGGKIQTRPWPGFPTDLMSPYIVLATQAKGTTLCHDWMYENRLFFVDKLISMGANITICDPHRVLVAGPTKLRGRELNSPDIRAGMALILASLAAEGRSVINNIELVERGYENIESRLKALGARIEREE